VDDAARLEFACPPARGRFRGLDLALLDRADRDERHFLILAEHPELARAIERNEDEIVVSGQPLNPRMHIQVHEIVVNQLWDDDPPEVWQTAQRLLEAGFERHEILHMIGSVLSAEIWTVLQGKGPTDPGRYVRALAGLPASWEAMRS